MLSKLLFFARHSSKDWSRLRSAIDPETVVRALGYSNFQVRRLSEGTLSASFLVRTGDASFFLKSPIIPEGVRSLYHEADILKQLYGTLFSAECVEVDNLGQPQHWLIMSELEHYTRDVSPPELKAILDDCINRIGSIEMKRTLPPEIHRPLMDEAYLALTNLSARSLIEPALHDKLRDRLDVLSAAWTGFPVQLCHGDLGPRNLMHFHGHPIIIDWEDIGWGFGGYDYLYWLTFIANRQYYGGDMWHKTVLANRQLEATVMVMIILLKSELAIRSGAISRQKLSQDARVREILFHATTQ